MIVKYRLIYCAGKQIGAVWQVGGYTTIQFAATYFPDDRGEVGWLAYSDAHLSEYHPMLHLHPLLRARFHPYHLTIGKTEQTPDLPETADELPLWAQRADHHFTLNGLKDDWRTTPRYPWHYHLHRHLDNLFRQANQDGAVWFEANP